MIEVVSAVIIREGRILLTQRLANKDFPFTWECPGGKVDGNESHHDAIRRELYEELGLDELGGICNTALWCSEFGGIRTSDGSEIFLLMYRVDLVSDPSPVEGQGIGWFTANEMRRLTLAPGNKRALESICRAIGTAKELVTERPL